MLLLDGARVHGLQDLEIIEFCRANKVHLFAYPPDLTHLLQGLDKVVFRKKSTNWAKFVTHINKTRSHRFTLRDLGRGLSALYLGNEDAGVFPTFTAAIAQSAFEHTGVFPFNPQAIDRSHLRPTAEIASPSNQAPLVRDGPARLVTTSRVSAFRNGPAGDSELQRAAQCELAMERDTWKAQAQALQEELEWFRSQVRREGKDGKRGAEVRGVKFGIGLCTADDIHAGLVAEAKEKDQAATRAKKAKEIRPEFRSLPIRKWLKAELEAACKEADLDVTGMSRAQIFEKYCERFPQERRKMSQRHEDPPVDVDIEEMAEIDSGSGTETDYGGCDSDGF